MGLHGTGPKLLEIYAVMAGRVENIRFPETHIFKMLKSMKKHKNS